ncbi:MAG: hypothetical protein B7Z55_01060 [Planctomycetales bacterium 12-60-4]|nr:MAG: hypothetical protein B7Z55_01060 [Planctomycetales bacterium 12-60-4]
MGYVMTQSTIMEMNLPNLPKPVVTTMQQKMYLEILTDKVAADGSAKQRQVIRRVISTVASTGGPVAQDSEYDSASAESPVGPLGEMLAKTLKPMVGAEWQQTVSARGEVSDIQVPEKFLEGLKSNPAAGMMGNMATPDGLKQLSTQAAMIFPEGAVQTGATWDSTVEVKLPFGTMSTKKITKYLGPGERELERMSVTTEVAFEPTPNAPATLKIVDNEADGEIVFDRQAGRLIKSSLRQVTNMQVSAGLQTFDQTVTTNVLYLLDEGGTDPPKPDR